MKVFSRILFAICLYGIAMFAVAQGNLDVNTAEISAIKQSMKQRHADLRPLYEAGAVGFANDGTVVLRDASSVPLAQRSRAQTLVAAENKDRAALYREISRANGHPEWENDIRKTFAARFIDRARSGWWVQGAGGWTRK